MGQEFCSSARTKKVDPQMLGNKHRHEYIIMHNVRTVHTQNHAADIGAGYSYLEHSFHAAIIGAGFAAFVGAGCSYRER